MVAVNSVTTTEIPSRLSAIRKTSWHAFFDNSLSLSYRVIALAVQLWCKFAESDTFQNAWKSCLEQFCGDKDVASSWKAAKPECVHIIALYYAVRSILMSQGLSSDYLPLKDGCNPASKSTLCLANNYTLTKLTSLYLTAGTIEDMIYSPPVVQISELVNTITTTSANKQDNVLRWLSATDTSQVKDAISCVAAGNGGSCLKNFILNSKHDVVKALLAAGVDANESIGHMTALHFSAECGEYKIGKILLAAGADIDATGKLSQSILHVAAKHGRAEFVRMLIEASHDVNPSDTDGETPLHLAAQNGHWECVKLLIRAGADVNARNRDQWTPLHLAAWTGNSKCVEMLADANCDVNAQQNHQYTPLHLAAQNGHTECAKALIDASCDVNAQQDHLYTPLHLAAQNGHIECVKVLIGTNCDVNAQQDHKYTPLHFAAQNGHSECAKVLIDANCDANAQQNHLYTPLHMAAQNGNVQCAKALITTSCDVQVREKFHCTPLHLAARFGNEQCTEMLIDANYNAKIINGHLCIWQF